MKPTPEQVQEWRAMAYRYADKQTGDYNEADEIAQEKFAELAAQWGAEQAQHEAKNAPWLTTAHIICTDAGITHGPISGRLVALRDKLAAQAQQTTEPLGFQIRRAIAAEDELRATKQTLEHAYAALQKVADAQAAIEEPELPEAEVHVRHGFDRNGSHSMGEYMCECGAHGDQPCKSDLYTATQMHDHYAAGVRAGMGRGQDAKRYRFIRDNIYRLPYDDHGAGPEFDLSEEAIDSAMQGGQK